MAFAELLHPRHGRGQSRGGQFGKISRPPAGIQTLDLAQRRGDAERIRFKAPVVGPSGWKLIGYEWRYRVKGKGKREEGRDTKYKIQDAAKRVSDWERARENPDTGKQIVHLFLVEAPAGDSLTTNGAEENKKRKIDFVNSADSVTSAVNPQCPAPSAQRLFAVSAASAVRLLGYEPKDLPANVKKTFSSVRRLGKITTAKAALEQRVERYRAAIEVVRAMPKPSVSVSVSVSGQTRFVTLSVDGEEDIRDTWCSWADPDISQGLKSECCRRLRWKYLAKRYEQLGVWDVFVARDGIRKSIAKIDAEMARIRAGF